MTVYNSEQLNKRIKKGHSISRWLLLITVIGTALSFFLLVGTASSSSYRNLVNEANQSQSVISELLATQIAGGLRWKKQDVVTGALDAYVGAVKQNSLALARIYNGKGELWLEHIPESHSDSSITVDNRMVDNNVGTAETISKLNDDLFTVAVPIVSGRNKDQIGTLFTIWDMSRKQSAARQILINSAWLALLFLVLLSVSLWWTVRRLIGKPLNKITSQMELLAKGDTNVDITGVGRKDEIGAIAQAVCVFKQDALEAQEIRVQQDAAEQEAEKQRLLAIKAQEEQQVEKDKQLEEQRERAEAEAATAKCLRKRIESLLNAVDAAAHGNLNYPIEHGDKADDLQKVSVALDNMFSTLRKSFEQIGQRITKLTASAANLKTLGATIASVSTESSSRTAHASETSVKVSASVETVASATLQMGTSIKQIASNAGDATTVAKRAVKLAENTDISIRQLAESSRSIGDVIKVINSIAEQTNLLALNATIEAARAGDAGKGFAVVANEVKDLAKETASATEEIEKRIASIQTDTGSAVQAIEDINKIVNQISETQSVIATSVEEQTSSTQEISRTIVQTSQANDEINDLMEGVVSQTQLAKDSAGEIESTASQLNEVAESIESLLQNYQYQQVQAPNPHVRQSEAS